LFFIEDRVCVLQELGTFIPLPLAVSSFDVSDYVGRQTTGDLFVKRILVLNLESFLNKCVRVALYEIKRNFVGHSAVQSPCTVCEEVVADDPISLNAQKREVAGAEYLDWLSLVYKGESDLGIAGILAKIRTKAGDEAGENDFSKVVAFFNFLAGRFDFFRILI
jgi:hypothetical protein